MVAGQATPLTRSGLTVEAPEADILGQDHEFRPRFEVAHHHAA